MINDSRITLLSAGISEEKARVILQTVFLPTTPGPADYKEPIW